jgi:hypothetical protein
VEINHDYANNLADHTSLAKCLFHSTVSVFAISPPMFREVKLYKYLDMLHSVTRNAVLTF